MNLSTQRYLPGFTRYSSLLAFVRFVTIISEWWLRKKSLPCGNVLKGVIGTRSARIEFWMHLNSLFNKCRRTVILILTKLCQDEQNKKSTAVLPRSRTDFVSMNFTRWDWQLVVGKSHLLFLGADRVGGGGGGGGDRKWVRMLVVPFRGQNQWSGTFYGVSNFSGLPDTQLVPFRVFFAQ